MTASRSGKSHVVRTAAMLCVVLVVQKCEDWKKKAQMAMGRAMKPEQPDLRPRNHRDLEFPSETVPEEVRELWASLPRRGRQRRRRRYFRDQGACCSRAVFSNLLSTIDIRVQNIESALAEFLHATVPLFRCPLRDPA